MTWLNNKLHATNGHKHTGGTDDAPQIGTSGLADSAVTNAKIASGVDASKLTVGTLPAERLPAHTGDVTSSAGSAALTLVAAKVLEKLLTVDGTGSGLDVDKLDGQEGSYYQNADNLNAGTLSMNRIANGAIAGAKLTTSYMPIAGGTFTGNVNMGTNILTIPTPTLP
jgi:hypothetical protein